MIGYDSVQLDMLEPTYRERLGLHVTPFSNSIDERFLYLDADHQQCLNMLRHMTQYSDLVLIAKGEAGAGKTTLMQHLIQTAASDWFVVNLSAQTLVSPETLLFKVAVGFEATLSPSDVDLMHEALLERLTLLHQRDLLPVLFVDDAHLLSANCLETLLLLADVESDNRRLLHVVMLAEPSIEDHFTQPQLRSLRDRLTHTIELPLFNEAESIQYLSHRLAAAGYQGELPLDDKTLKKIYRSSNGLPARLNQLAHQALEGSELEDNDVIDETHHTRKAPWRMLLGGVVIILLALVLLYQSEINRFFMGETKTTKPEQQATAVPGPSPFAPNLPLKPVLPDTPRTVERIIELNPEVASAPANSQTTTSTPATTAPDTAVAVAAVTTPQITGIRPDPVPGSKVAQTVVISGSGFTPESKVTVSWPGGSKTLSSQQYNVLDGKSIQITLNTGDKDSEWNITAADAKNGISNTFYFKIAGTAAVSAPTTTPAKSIMSEALTQGHAWIRQQDAGHFTMQLLGSRSESSINDYVRKHALQGKVALYRSIHQGGDWYALIYGSYADRPQAEAAATSLPPAAQKNRPWVRRMGDVQALLADTVTATRAAPTKSTKPTAVKTAPTTTQASNSYDEAWLWSQDPSGFTIQLMSSPNSSQVERMKQRLKLPQKLLIFTTQHEGKAWATLVYGSFQTQAAAKDAINLLPADLRQSAPWVRSFASVHAELHRTSE